MFRGYRVSNQAWKMGGVIQIVGIIYSIEHLELRSKTDFSTPLPQNLKRFCYTFQLLVAG